MMWQRIWSLVIKELLAVWRDKKSRMVLIIPPMAQLIIFSFAATLDVKNASIAILNHDSGKVSTDLIQQFVGSPTFASIVYLQGVEQIRPTIDQQRAMMVLHIDESFSRQLYAGKPASVQLILDGRKSNTTQIVAGYATEIINQFSDAFAKERGFPVQSARLIVRNWYNPNLIYLWFNVPNLVGILTMVVSLIITALSVARERELGTFDQLLVSPMEPFEIVVGKTLPAVIISLGEATLILGVAIGLYQIPFLGSLWVLYVSLIVFVFAVVGVGLFLSSICKTQQQAILASFVFMSPALLLSGYATPIENMPVWLQKIDLINPIRYFLVITKGVFLKGMPFSIAWELIWPMAVIAFFNLLGANWMFRRRLE